MPLNPGSAPEPVRAAGAARSPALEQRASRDPVTRSRWIGAPDQSMVQYEGAVFGISAQMEENNGEESWTKVE